VRAAVGGVTVAYDWGMGYQRQSLVASIGVLGLVTAGCGSSGSAPPSTTPIPANASPAHPSATGHSAQQLIASSPVFALDLAGYTCGRLEPMHADPTIRSAPCTSKTSHVQLIVTSATHPGGANALSVYIAECNIATQLWPSGAYFLRPTGASWTLASGDVVTAQQIGRVLGLGPRTTEISCR
jgi:hypothetical protein